MIKDKDRCKTIGLETFLKNRTKKLKKNRQEASRNNGTGQNRNPDGSFHSDKERKE